jgi:ABC-type polysaccharide/polyol phosphate transport system ATPase subunit
MSAVIKIENLGKRYRIRSQTGYVNLKEVITHQFARLTSRKSKVPPYRELWALRDVSVEILAGELIGLVGLNGSGKSTLLKLLAEVTKPTTGTISLWGRIGSLLEVGTGFHPELTGRENIYFSGSILGMSWNDISRKFDEIVAFSEVEQYLDMPVKRYSSGMYMRLAFSVAAHLDPDILLIDEALAVGDMNFRRKCMAMMQSFVKSGATVIFVSHNMGLLAETCTRCLLLEKGQLVEEGPAATVIQRYLRNTRSGTEISFPSVGSTFFSRLRINQGRPPVYGERFDLEVSLLNLPTRQGFTLGFGFCSLDGSRLLSCEGIKAADSLTPQDAGEVTLQGSLPALPLAPGVYLLDLVLRDGDNHILEHRPACAQVEILSDEKSSRLFSAEAGGVRLACHWERLATMSGPTS